MLRSDTYAVEQFLFFIVWYITQYSVPCLLYLNQICIIYTLLFSINCTVYILRICVYCVFAALRLIMNV